MGEQSDGLFEVGYDVPGRGQVVEATVAKCKNGLAINYADPYMRRRDPDCMVVGDAKPTDKESYVDRFGEPFDSVRVETLEWLKRQNLAVFAFILGGFVLVLRAIALEKVLNGVALQGGRAGHSLILAPFGPRTPDA